MISLPFIQNQKNLVPSFRLSAISEGTLEGEFVRNILRDILLVNIAWLSLLLIGYSLWIRSLFRPIIVVTSTLQNIIDRRHYASIRYSANNEFTPLIRTINNLHKSLSIQEKIRSDFLSDLSHEIRTPVTAVKCYLEAIQDGAMELDANTVNLLQSELERLAHITGRIMDYESLTHDVFDAVNVDRFSLKKVSLDIINEYKPQLMRTNQVIDIDFPDDTMTSMDKGMYIQVLHNIISNFIKYA
jgi:signal transduction histidine kinase